MSDLALTLGVTAGVLQLVGYTLYLRLTKGANAGSWMIWTFGAAVDAASYFLMTEGEIAKNALPIACALACCITFIVLLCMGRFGWPDANDWFLIFIDGGISVVWLTHNMDTTTANLLFQASTVLSFIPILRGQFQGSEEAEHPLPWFVWSGAYSLLLAAVLLQLDKWEELAYPITHLVLHGAVLVIATSKRLSSTA